MPVFHTEPAPPRAMPGSARHEIPPPPAFRAILSRECARADRAGQGGSLVIFAAEGPRRVAPAVLRHLAHAMAGRARRSDAVGWLDERRVAVLLPTATAAGARAFVESLRETMGSYAPAPSFSIHAYPWAPDAGPCPRSSPTRDAAPVPRTAMPAWKRAMDVLGAAAGLLLLSPVILLIAAFIRIVSPGPAFFRQERIGYMGKPFLFWKFRTMHNGCAATCHEQYLHRLIRTDAPMNKLDDGRDPRIIPLGRFLRRSFLDELPQLFNVLAGDMSLVGPRPCLPYEAREFEAWHRQRFAAVPGMTGLWQVSGKNRTSFSRMIRLDIVYARELSFLLDVKILLKTVSVVLGSIIERSRP